MSDHLIHTIPILMVLSGPSGAGKTTIVNALRDTGWEGSIVVTVTTRAPRYLERDGIDYHFTSEQQFREMISRGEFLESAEVHGQWYGVPLKSIDENLSSGVDCLLTIDYQGASTVRARVKESVSVFLAAESLDQLAHQVAARQSESQEQMQLRLHNARLELAAMANFDYVIVNRPNQMQKAVEHLRAIITAEHCRVGRSYPAITRLE